MNEAKSQAGSSTTFSHEDSTIDGKIFDWDDDIVNTEIYRRALTHARSKANMVRKPEEGEVEHDIRHQTDTQGLHGRLSQTEPHGSMQQQKPEPYESSVVSAPIEVYGQQSRHVRQLSSMSDTALRRRNILSLQQKSPETEKKSFWSSLVVAKRSSRTSLASPGRQVSQSSLGPANPTPGSRRGRRGFGNSFHMSIDFSSTDGLATPAIVRAAQAGSVIEVETLLDQRADIKARHVNSGRNALAVASHCGNEDVVRLLLQYGANVNERDASLMTPLHLAASRGHYAVVESLLQDGAVVDGKGPNDETPLRIASDNGHIETVELLLGKRAKVNARDRQQLTALHMAAKRGDEAMVDLLVSNSAHVEAKDGSFMAAIHYASEEGHDGVVGLLLTKKADIEAPGRASKSPLACASSAGQTHVVELLLKKKASLKQKGEGDMNPLHWASFNGHVEVVDLLLQKRASINTPNKDGRTPLHLAVMANNFAVAELLLRKGAVIEAQCRSRFRPLHYACREANEEVVQLLLVSGANIEAENDSAKRPLHFAATRGSAPLVELLLQRRVNIEARDAAGDPPLCLASGLGHLPIVRMLLDTGAPLRSKFSKGPSHEDSPLCLAAKNGHVSVVSELINRRASVLQKDEFNWPPLRYAAFYGHPEVVQLLLLHGASVSGNPSGGWGFNMTASRIGFANNVRIDEDRKGQVLRFLHDAEAREQTTQERLAAESAPLANPNQAAPSELGHGRDGGGGIGPSPPEGSPTLKPFSYIPTPQAPLPIEHGIPIKAYSSSTLYETPTSALDGVYPVPATNSTQKFQPDTELESPAGPQELPA